MDEQSNKDCVCCRLAHLAEPYTAKYSNFKKELLNSSENFLKKQTMAVNDRWQMILLEVFDIKNPPLSKICT
jgi:hypothetical protein